jgi:citrate synthase
MLLDKEQKIARPRQIYTGYDERPYEPKIAERFPRFGSKDSLRK